ncbi:MAG: META domain-containing protein, partial [Chloroflexota bacterium]|nr:META domain-containing protein [Chloroflexota bacterium]
MRKLIVMILLISSISILAACSSAETPTVAPASATEPPEAPAAPTEALQTASLEDILDITWQWAGLVETEPASQSVVPNPEIYTIIFRDDGAVNIQADCNMVGGTYNLEGSALKIELGPSTMAYCGDDSLDQQYLMLLDQVNSFGMEAERLKLADETFRMGFNNGGPAEEPEEPEITTCDAGIDPATVTLDTMGLPYAYKPNCVPGTPYDNSQPPGPTGLSDHIQVNFGVVDPQEVQPNDPIIYIIPVEEYKQLWDDAGDESVSNSIERLQELLQEKPDPVPTSGIPILPTERLMGVSDLQVQGMYLDIYMGSGVRFVTRFSQGPNPVTGDNPRLFYTFQGFSWDGEDLITFFYPVTTSALPTSDSVSPEEQERVDSDPTGYLEEKTTELNALLSSDWEPDLNTLDAMIISLGYGEPREAVNPLIDINWQWAELIETEPAAQSLVPNPLIYTLVFYQDGSLFYQADCNSGSGSYTTDGNQLSIELGVSTLVECGPDSLSNQFITLLGSVESYGFESGRLELGLQGGSGSMIF